MNWNKFHLDWPGIYLYSTFQVIPPGIQSRGMKNFGGGGNSSLVGAHSTSLK